MIKKNLILIFQEESDTTVKESDKAELQVSDDGKTAEDHEIEATEHP